MTCYIERNGTPINDKTYDSVAEALEAFAAPGWVGAEKKELEMLADNKFRYLGMTFEILEGENPKKARAEARAAAPAKPADRATAAQIRYLNILGKNVPQSAWDAWVKPGMTKADASRAIEALKNIATK